MNRERTGTGRMERRSFLRLAGGAAAASAIGTIVACTPESDPPSSVEVPLAALPIGGRERVLLGEMPVELHRTEEGVVARSLWCTHTGCEVKWVVAEEGYHCPCHDGRFDAAGSPISGPPPRPLQDLPVVISDGMVIVGSPA